MSLNCHHFAGFRPVQAGSGRSPWPAARDRTRPLSDGRPRGSNGICRTGKREATR